MLQYASFMVVLIAGAWTVSSQLSDINTRLRAIEGALGPLTEKVALADKERMQLDYRLRRVEEHDARAR